MNSGKTRKANVSTGSRKVSFTLHFFPLNPTRLSVLLFLYLLGICDTEVCGCMQAHRYNFKH